MIFDKRDDGLKRATSQWLRNEGKQDLERARLQQMLEWSCWKPTTKRIILIWSYEIHLKIMRWQSATHGKELYLFEQGDEKVFPLEDKEELGSFMSTIIATILREGFRWNITQDNSKDEIGGSKISHSWQHVNHEKWTQIIKNDIIPSPKIRKKELHSG